MRLRVLTSLDRRSGAPFLVGAGVLCLSACGTILGLDDFTDGPATTTSGTTTTSEGGGTTTTTTTTSSSAGGGGATGAGGGGSGGGLACEPATSVACYEGPAGTEGHGACKAGMKTCLSDGSGYGACNGDVVPAAMDDCIGKVDTNCDDQLDCACDPNSMEPCYDGPANTEGVGVCIGGTHTCKPDGTGYGSCVGQVLPDGVETCGNTLDDDCDTVVDQNCVCTPATTQACYTGPSNTEGVGKCVGGMQTCNAQGNAWGPCLGQIVPQPEACDVAGDENCDGIPCSETVWAKLVETTANGEFFGWKNAVVGAGGSVIAVGYGDAPLDVGDGNIVTTNSAFLVKYDSTGAVQWFKTFPYFGQFTQAPSVAVDSSGKVYVAGEFSGTLVLGGTMLTSAGGTDIFVAAYDAAGTQQYAKSFGGVGDEGATGIVADDFNAVIVVGQFTGSFKFVPAAPTLGPAAGLDIFVAKLSAAGASYFWSLSIGDATGQPAAAQIVNGVATDPGNNVYVGGAFNQSIKLSGTDHLTLGASDAFVAKILANGSPAWGRVMGGTAADGVAAVAVDGAGNPVVAGTINAIADFGGGPLQFGGGSDAVLAKYDTTGLHLWSKSVNASGAQIAEGVGIDGDGNIVASTYFGAQFQAGNKTLTPIGSGDIAVMKFDPAGNGLWARSFGSTDDDYGSVLAVGHTGNRIAVGFHVDMGAAVDYGLGPMSGTNGTGPIGVLYP